MTKLRSGWQLADYRKTGVIEYDESPVITALQPLWDRDVVRTKLVYAPRYDVAIRQASRIVRLHSLVSLTHLFQCLSMHLDLELFASKALRQSLTHRNPLRLGFYYRDAKTRVEVMQ